MNDDKDRITWEELPVDPNEWRFPNLDQRSLIDKVTFSSAANIEELDILAKNVLALKDGQPHSIEFKYLSDHLKEKKETDTLIWFFNVYQNFRTFGLTDDDVYILFMLNNKVFLVLCLTPDSIQPESDSDTTSYSLKATIYAGQNSYYQDIIQDSLTELIDFVFTEINK